MSSDRRTCLNCGQPAGPQFCGYCGQSIDDYRSPLVGLARELVEETISIDSRAIRTLRALLHPGRLTRLYLDGKRVRFLTPLRLYLLTSVALFSSLLTLRPPDAREINLYIAGALVTGPAVRGRTNITIMAPDSAMARWMIAGFSDKFSRLRAQAPQEVVDRLFNGLRSVLPAALIAGVPLLALALKLLYLKRRVLYVDHLIFGVHFQSALFLALAATWLVVRVLSLPFLASLIAYVLVSLWMMTVYLGMSLRRVYAEARWTAALRTALLVVAYFVVFSQVSGIAALVVILGM